MAEVPIYKFSKNINILGGDGAYKICRATADTAPHECQSKK
ncbi:hypothetical protein CWATWH8502_2294 [Crocosphaera watsonii WH 8502]|uniref:Uncharacterized protein n=1 Tax=Crocosphaera watsonii WH 8502 TaxID=423474 RepID=T2IIX4_CROWT|nr:hypothetical protein CWATWH8502_2294 [Crocosphaera watsonii WH 8502]